MSKKLFFVAVLLVLFSDTSVCGMRRLCQVVKRGSAGIQQVVLRNAMTVRRSIHDIRHVSYWFADDDGNLTVAVETQPHKGILRMPYIHGCPDDRELKSHELNDLILFSLPEVLLNSIVCIDLTGAEVSIACIKYLLLNGIRLIGIVDEIDLDEDEEDFDDDAVVDKEEQL